MMHLVGCGLLSSLRNWVYICVYLSMFLYTLVSFFFVSFVSFVLLGNGKIYLCSVACSLVPSFKIISLSFHGLCLFLVR